MSMNIWFIQLTYDNILNLRYTIVCKNVFVPVLREYQAIYDEHVVDILKVEICQMHGKRKSARQPCKML